MPNPTQEPIVVSWSEISSRRACPHKHHLEYRERWTKQKPLNSALGKGTLFHACLEAYYLGRKEGLSPGLCLLKAVNVLEETPIESEFDQEAVDTVRWMLVGYHDMYQGDSLWSVVAVEHRFRVKLPQVMSDQPEIWLKGSIDLLVRDERNRLIVVDHKTCASLPKDQSFELSDQFSLYLWALRELGIVPYAAMHNAIKTKRNKGDIPGAIEEWAEIKAAGGRAGAEPKMQTLEQRFARKLISRTPRELTTIAREAAATAAQAYRNPHMNERNPNEDYCRFMCSFREPCLDGRKYGREFELGSLRDAGYVQDFTRH